MRPTRAILRLSMLLLALSTTACGAKQALAPLSPRIEIPPSLQGPCVRVSRPERAQLPPEASQEEAADFLSERVSNYPGFPRDWREQIATLAAEYAAAKQIQERSAWGQAFNAESAQHAAECARRAELLRLAREYNEAVEAANNGR